MGSIKFNKKNNRRKRILPGKDHYSGLVIYNNTLPAGFSDVDNIITPETKATSTSAVTTIGNDDNVILVFVPEPGGIVHLAEYKKVAGDNTAAKVATAIANAINAHPSGYTAVAAGANYTVTARPGLGTSINGIAVTHASTDNSFVGTSVVFAGGTDVVTGTTPTGRVQLINDIDAAVTAGITANNADVGIQRMHYHISEVFRMNPDAVLYVGIFAVPVGAHTFSEISTVRTFANNQLRQVGVFTPKAYNNADCALLQDMYDAAFDEYAPFEILYSPNFVGIATGALADLSGKNAPDVHLLIAQDGAAAGAALFAATPANSVGIIGAVLGALSLAKVNENIGWVEKFNFAEDGGELDVPALANGDLIQNLSVNLTKNGGTFDTKRLMFLKKYPGQTGTFLNDTHGACPANRDDAFIEDNRTLDKAIRGIYLALLPNVNGPTLLLPGTSKLDPLAISLLELDAKKVLEQMQNAGELSGYSVTIDPDQDVVATNKIVFEISNTEIGVSRNFEINIGY